MYFGGVVALKLLNDSKDASAAARQAAEQELATLKSLRHNNIVHVCSLPATALRLPCQHTVTPRADASVCYSVRGRATTGAVWGSSWSFVKRATCILRWGVARWSGGLSAPLASAGAELLLAPTHCLTQAVWPAGHCL